jgi:hypothetical protein
MRGFFCPFDTLPATRQKNTRRPAGITFGHYSRCPIVLALPAVTLQLLRNRHWGSGGRGLFGMPTGYLSTEFGCVRVRARLTEGKTV